MAVTLSIALFSAAGDLTLGITVLDHLFRAATADVYDNDG